jgi:phosphoglycerate dehydrogenase-like enzyme
MAPYHQQLKGDSELVRLIIASRLDDQVRRRLVDQHWEIESLLHKPGQWVLPEPELIAGLQDADILVTEADDITPRVLHECTHLKAVISCRGTAVNVNLPAATEEGVLIANTPGRNADAVADLCVCLMIMVARNIELAVESLRNGKWANSPRATVYLACQGYELPGRTIGLIGLGAIGRKVASRLRGFQMRILAYDPYVTHQVADTAGATLVPLEELLHESDFVSLHCHVSAETRGLLGSHELEMMKPSAFLINTARAELVEEPALLRALQEKRIAGGALDVYHQEPLRTDHPLLELSNVVLLPHIGGATVDVIRHQSETAEANLEALRQGYVPPNLENREVLKSPRLRLPRLAER